VSSTLRRNAAALAALAAICAATVALADTMGRELPLGPKGYVEGFRSDTRAALYFEGADGTDSVSDVGTATVAGGSGVDGRKQIYCKGFARVAISGQFSVASATCVVYVSRLNKGSSNWTFRSGTQGTLTAVSSAPVLGSMYPSVGSVAVSTHGAEWIVVTYSDPSSGYVDLQAEVY